MTHEKRRVLVTGSAGRIGKAVCSALLERGHFVRAFDRVETPLANEKLVGDIADYAAVSNAIAGMEQIVHLAAVPDDDDFMTMLLPNNIVAIHHVFEAARKHGVKRVTLASTGQVNWWQQEDGPHPVKNIDPITPRYWYATAKVFAEFAGKVFAHDGKMDVLAARLGACPRDRALIEYIDKNEHNRNVYLSPGDAGRFFTKAVEAPYGFGFQVVFGFSKPVTYQVFDPEPARTLLGYEAQDKWPEGVPPELA